MPIATTVRRFHALPGNVKGSLMIFAAAFGFSVMVLLVKVAGERLHVTQILLVRQVVMMAIVMPQVMKEFPGCLRTSRLDLQIIRVALALVAMLAGFTAIIEMPLADAVAIGFAKSFFVTIFAIWLLKEQVGWRRWMAVAVGFLGVLVMVQPGSSGFDPYSLYALAGAAAAGLVMVIIRLLSRTDEPITILAYQAFLVGLCVAIPAIYFWQWPTVTEWVLLLAMGVTSFAAQMGNIYAYKWGEASVLASLDYVRLLYATFFGWLIFDTLPGPYTWVGSVVIIAAALYTVQRERARNTKLVRSPQGREHTNT
ncbi:DMT family transporter [Ahrensia sp. R2A130]|uniref:DMT family transporter n=1 Tax=Ahrensia sp. R2A130 TaxID=744979 RepID=UPI0001E0F0D0|nr:DMT family transporter [Ahrensia sp. R2A130]EFL88986.1 putative integral membrane protein [Ahrensia sp. R2A130]